MSRLQQAHKAVRPALKTCSVGGCDFVHEARGLCATHYKRWRRHGDTKTILKGGACRLTPDEMAASAISRFWLNVDTTGDCWLWTGTLNDGGYGRHWVGNDDVPAHRFSYEMVRGSIPPGFDLDHICHTADLSCPGGVTCLHRSCVRPGHLEPVTRSENLRRGRRWQS